MNQGNDIENIFQDGLEDHQVMPSAEVLKKLRRNLFIRDFFSVNPRKVNILYAGIVLIGVVLAPVTILQKPNNTESLSDIEDSSGKNVFPEEKPSETIIEASPEKQNNVSENRSKLVSVEFEPSSISGCVPLTVRFENNSTNAENFSWDFGNGDKSGLASPKYTFVKPGTYSVRLKAFDKKGESFSQTHIITVHDNPVSEFEIDPEGSLPDSKKVLFKNTSKKASSYKWDFGDRKTSTEVDPLHAYQEYKRYQVSLIAYNKYGCSDTVSTDNALIEKDYRLIFPNQFRPNISSVNNGMYARAENEPFVFYPKHFGVSNYNLRIIAPNGSEIFTSSDIKIGWNGYIRGRLAPAGVYRFEASGIYPNGIDFKQSGQVKVIIDNRYDNFYDQ